MNCTKAIIPVAGYGTRRLPITKVIEKCMLPVGNRPTIDYVVQDLVKAGVQEIIFVISGEGRQLREYYSHNEVLEQYLREKGKEELIATVTPPEEVTFRYVTQSIEGGKYGTSVPVWLCREYIEPDESVFVWMGDDFVYSADDTSEAVRLLNSVSDGEAALLGVSVPRDEVGHYGVIVVNGHNEYVAIQEKPKPAEAKSTLINISKYIVPSAFWQYLEADMARDHQGGEYQIIDALNAFVDAGHTAHVIEAAGQYCDSGTLEGWLAANQYVATHSKI